jgi:flavin-dependent dehydrogenase
MDVGSVLIETPLREKRIAAVHRGPGPRGIREMKWDSFDAHLLDLAVGRGANLIPERVEKVSLEDGRPLVETKGGSLEAYDVLVVATGVNSKAVKMFEGLGIGYTPPRTTKTAILEYYLGGEDLGKYLGNSMHVFLLNLPRLEFGAIIPKGDYMTVCLLGEEIDKELLESFLGDPAVKGCLPPDWNPDKAGCQCMPRMNIRGVDRPYADRIVFIGDCGMNRLNKDGIGGAYRSAKAAATTAVLQGVSAEDFRRHFMPTCRSIGSDNRIGELVFTVVRQIQKRRFARRAILRMAKQEQQNRKGQLRLSTVLWDTFTGSAPYREILMRTLHPAYLIRLFANLAVSIWPAGRTRGQREVL